MCLEAAEGEARSDVAKNFDLEVKSHPCTDAMLSLQLRLQRKTQHHDIISSYQKDAVKFLRPSLVRTLVLSFNSHSHTGSYCSHLGSSAGLLRSTENHDDFILCTAFRSGLYSSFYLL